jgi:hypothetical protein
MCTDTACSLQEKVEEPAENAPVHVLRAAPKRKRAVDASEATSRPATLADNGSPRPAVKRKRTALVGKLANRNQFVNSLGKCLAWSYDLCI